MIFKKRVFTAAATFAIAGSAGYVMQNGDAFAARFTADENVAQSVPSDQPMVNLASVLPTPPNDAALPNGFEANAPVFLNRLVAFNTEFTTDTLTDISVPIFYPASCDVSLEAIPTVGAMVDLELKAPCYQNQRIEISHGGLEFAESTNTDGSFSVQVPALYEYEPFTVTFLDGRTVEAKTLMLSVDGYERVAISWAGSQNLNIHGLENGTVFGNSGHVWARAANIPMAEQDVTGGFLIELGNPNLLAPKLAEIYSHPVGRDGLLSGVELIVEAEIDGQSCGTSLTGQSIQISAVGVRKNQ